LRRGKNPLTPPEGSVARPGGAQARRAHQLASLAADTGGTDLGGRAVISRPSLLLADEPTGNLDDGIGVRLMYLFEELNKMGTTVVVATHNEG